jgi:D-alanyl-D-alanine carboxypeptidase (penicillin-binding protein 5/6)
MKTRRFFAVFLLFALLTSLFAVSPALADETQTASQTPPTIDIAAKAALLVDRKTGVAVYAKNEHEELYPASLTKIMTALLVLEAVDSGKLTMDTQLTASASAMAGLDEGGSTANIKPGEVLTVQELLYCMLVVSANEACTILAEAVDGDVDTFVAAMNAKAKDLGCVNTHFANPTGLQDPQHYTSAWDLWLITQEALTHKEFMTFCDTSDVVLPATNLSKERHLYSTNYLLSSYRALGYIDKDAHGVKTGSTSDAGHCLVSTAARGSLSFASVVLGAEKVTLPSGKAQVQSFSETSRLFNWAFENFAYQTILTKEETPAEVSVTLSREVNYVTVHPAEDTSVLLPKALKPEDLKRTVRFSSQSVEAPVKAGQQLGEIILSYGDTVYATVPLLASNDVAASRLLLVQRQIGDFFHRTSVRIVCALLAALVLALVVWKLTVGRRRYRYGKSVSRPRNYRGRRRF